MRVMTKLFVVVLVISAGTYACQRDGGGTDKTGFDVVSDALDDGYVPEDGLLPDGVGDSVSEDGDSSVPPDSIDINEDIEIVPFPELPPPEAEPLEIITCENDIPVPEAGTCSVKVGDEPLLIQGIILGLDKVWVGGEVLVDATGMIVCVDCDCSGHELAGTATVVSCADGVVSPGLINAHDHITYAHNHPGDWGDERYEHRHDWRKGIRGHKAISYKSGASNKQVTWGELRHVLSGATSLAGSGKASGFLRNLDKAAQEGLNQDPVYYNTFPLGDGGGKLLDSGCDYPGIDGWWVLESDCYLPHVAEGIDKETRNEFLCLSGDANGGVDLTESNSAFIHGIGLRADDGSVLAENGTAIIWSPRSNISLYGHTAQVTMYDRQGVLIGLGTDWTASGSMNMQRELQCAALYDDVYCGDYFTDHELWLMATAWNAMALSVADATGVLHPNRVADIAIYRANGSEQYHRAIIDGAIEDVVLVLRGGLPLYGDAEVIAGLPFGNSEACEEIPDGVCGVSKAVCVKRETGMSWADLAAGNTGNYPLFFCAEPEGEVTCIPSRGESKGGKFTGQSTAGDPDGDGVEDPFDNCPSIFNPIRPVDELQQGDYDNDGIGDACDPCPTTADTYECDTPDPFDRDDDDIHDLLDNCPSVANPKQEDDEADGVGNACDYCPHMATPLGTPCEGTIYDIKTGTILEGGSVEVFGVVTAKTGSQFFLQVAEDEHSDEYGYQYSGVYVFLPDDNPDGITVPEQGDYIRVMGTIQDWWGQLQLTWITDIEVLATGTLLPTPVFETPANLGTGGDMAEAYEGVLVMVQGSTVTELNPPAGPGDDDPTNEYVLDGALRINDFMYLTEPFPEVDSVMSIMGILRWANDDSKLEPRDAMDIIPELGLKALSPESVWIFHGVEPAQTIPELVVQLNTWAPEEGVVVTLESSDPTLLTVPESVTVPDGELWVAVPVEVVQVEAALATVVVTAGLGDASVTAQVSILPSDYTAPINVASGVTSVDASTEVSVSFTAPTPPGGTIITVEVDDPTILNVPETVEVGEYLLETIFEVSGLKEGSTSLTVHHGPHKATVTFEVLSIPQVGFIITEVFYDPPGTDGDKEWVELFNGTTEAIDLSGFSLGAAGTEYSYSVVQLAGTLEPGQCFVVGGPTSGADNGNPVFDQSFDFNPDFQNSGPDADAVALFAMTSSQITNTSVPIDAVLYGGSNGNNLIDESGEPGDVDSEDASSGHSVQLNANGWVVQPEPTPNDCSHITSE
jgi:large repetitive protein